MPRFVKQSYIASSPADLAARGGRHHAQPIDRPCFGAERAICAPASADEMVAIDQGWSTRQKVEWYTLTQGSRLLPLAWFRALEQPGSNKLFLDRAHIESFRYLPHASAGAGRLPVGFTIDTQDDSDLDVTRSALEAEPVEPRSLDGPELLSLSHL